MHKEPQGGVPQAARRPGTVSTVLGIVLAVVFVLGGLALVGAIMIFFTGLAHYGSNK